MLEDISFQGRRLGGSMGAITTISFEKSYSCTHQFLLKQGLKGNLNPLIQIPKGLFSILHSSIEIPKDAPAFYSQINHEEDHEHPVELKDASFSWSDDHLKVGCSLVDISWHVPDGTLVAVVGAVGSGKSSLLSGTKKSQLGCGVDTSILR